MQLVPSKGNGVFILAHGIDLVENQRIAAMLRRHPQRFVQRVFTQAERARFAKFRDPVAHVAGRFAAKEALLKMIGTGWRGGIAWTDMEIVNNPAGQPVVTLTGETARIAQRLGIGRILLSITHTKNYAAASAIGVRE